MNTASSKDLKEDDLPPVEEGAERHEISGESELRLEVSNNTTNTCTVTLQRGSCELWGVELALKIPYNFDSNSKLALFTWHGCVLDVRMSDGTSNNLFAYTSDETQANVAFVNTHAQIEALRDEAMQTQTEGPRVLVVGPAESGKSSLVRILAAYATKLGRAPLWVDLDPADNALAVPGTLAVAPLVTPLSVDPCATPEKDTLVLWHGTSELKKDNAKLYEAQVSAIGERIAARLQQRDADLPRASGILVNTHGWIQDEGYEMLLHTIQALRISIVLILGHDRLYSMLKSHFDKAAPPPETMASAGTPPIKIVKLPRSGGVVSRDAAVLRQVRSKAIKRYFYGHSPSSLTPFLAHVPIDKVTIYKYASLALSASLLPVAGKQSTESVQLQTVTVNEKLQHAVLAVCHPLAVQAYEVSGLAKDLYQSGVAGFVTVERVLMETEMLHLLSPCAGALPSHTLILGEITWME